MKFDVVEQKGIETKIKIDIPAKEVSEAFTTVLRAVARQVKIPGFRPGRAPKGVLMQFVGEEALRQEVKEHLVEKSFAKAIKDLKLNPVDISVNAELPIDGSDYGYEANLELYPEIKLPDLKEIIIDSDKEEVDEDELEQSLEQLRQENAILVPVDRPVKKDDYLMVEMIHDGEGENNSLPVDLVKTSDSFAEQFIGKKLGDIFDVDLDAAEGEEPVQLKIKISDIKEKEVAELNDDFAKDLGLESLEELTNNVRLSLQREKDEETFSAQREEFVEKLIAETDFELPKSLVKRQKESMIKDVKSDLKKDGITFDGYIKEAYADDKTAFEKEIEETATDRVRRDLVLEQLLTDRKTVVTNKEFESAIAYMAASYRKKPNAFKKEMGKTWLKNYRFLLERDKAVNEALAEVLEANKEEETKAETDEQKAEKNPKPKKAVAAKEEAKTADNKAKKKATKKPADKPAKKAAKKDNGEE